MFRKTTDRSRGICGIYLNSIKKNQKITTCNRVGLGNTRILTDPAWKSPRHCRGQGSTSSKNSWTGHLVLTVWSSRSYHACTLPLMYRVYSYRQPILLKFVIFWKWDLHELSRILNLSTFEIIIGGLFRLFLYFYPCDPFVGPRNFHYRHNPHEAFECVIFITYLKDFFTPNAFHD